MLSSILNQFTSAEWAVAGLLLLCFLVQVFCYIFLYNRPYRYSLKRRELAITEDELPGISVIITSKENADELGKNLPFILDQDYPRFEVIVVNRGSTDDTDMVLKAAEQKYPHLYHTFVPEESENINEKKLALTLGIKAAKYDFLLFTEAYCKPCSNHWIKEFGAEFAQGKDIVLGANRLDIPRKAALRGFMLYDNLIHHLKFLSMAIYGKPFMGIGRNMAYKKEIFFQHKGFSSILNMDNGEDDLFINKIAPGKETGVILSEESMTGTENVRHFSEWRALKSNYLYTKQYYKGGAFRIFGLDTVSKYLFYLTLICATWLISVNGNLYLAAICLTFFIIRYILQLYVMIHGSRLLNAGRYHINLLFYDILQPLNNIRFKHYATRRNRSRNRNRG